MLTAASRNATTAATVTHAGRSPSSRRTSVARTASFLASLRSLRESAGPAAGTAAGRRCFRLRGLVDTRLLADQRGGGGAWVVRVADGAHHGEARGAGLGHGRGVARVDAPDGEPRLGGCVAGGIAHEVEASGLDALL